MPVFRAFVRSVVVLVATTVGCAALVGLMTSTLAGDADAAPYPPTEPCSVTATARGAAAADGTNDYDVVGSGLGATQPVRVVLATTGQEVGSAQTDSAGGFRTVITAPSDADASAPDLTASSPQRTCTWTPPPATTPPPTRAPTTPGQPSGPGRPTTGDRSSPGASPGDGRPDSASSTPESSGASGGGSSTAPSSSAIEARPSASSTPPLAEPSPGTETPFGVGLGIAAVLLVLGTLAVLLLTRRPEH